MQEAASPRFDFTSQIKVTHPNTCNNSTYRPKSPIYRLTWRALLNNSFLPHMISFTIENFADKEHVASVSSTPRLAACAGQENLQRMSPHRLMRSAALSSLPSTLLITHPHSISTGPTSLRYWQRDDFCEQHNPRQLTRNERNSALTTASWIGRRGYLLWANDSEAAQRRVWESSSLSCTFKRVG